MALEGLQLISRFAPQLHRFVQTGGGEGLPVRTKGHTIDSSVVALEGLQLISRFAPQLHHFVPTGGGDRLPVRTKGHTPNSIAVAFEPITFLQSRCIS